MKIANVGLRSIPPDVDTCPSVFAVTPHARRDAGRITAALSAVCIALSPHFAHAVPIRFDVPKGRIVETALMDPRGKQALVGDFDGDGLQDVLMTMHNFYIPYVHLFKGPPGGGLGTSISVGPGGTAAAADLNLDGVFDYVATVDTRGGSYWTAQVNVRLGQRNNPFLDLGTKTFGYSHGSEPAVGDVDGDSIPDPCSGSRPTLLPTVRPQVPRGPTSTMESEAAPSATLARWWPPGRTCSRSPTSTVTGEAR
jgi:hypothetical protein